MVRIALLLFLLCFFLMNGCVTMVPPPYDKGLSDEIASVNAAIMRFFASVSEGTSADSYKDREEKYNILIGKLDALIIEARSRPTPEKKVLEEVSSCLKCGNVSITRDITEVSPLAISEVKKKMVEMRKADKDKGLKDDVLRDYETYIKKNIKEALIYENCLER